MSGLDNIKGKDVKTIDEGEALLGRAIESTEEQVDALKQVLEKTRERAEWATGKDKEYSEKLIADLEELIALKVANYQRLIDTRNDYLKKKRPQ